MNEQGGKTARKHKPLTTLSDRQRHKNQQSVMFTVPSFDSLTKRRFKNHFIYIRLMISVVSLQRQQVHTQST